MAYQITITADAESQLQALPVYERRIVEAAVVSRLSSDPTTSTKSIKRLRPNPLAEFELRVGDIRVLYNVEGTEIVLLVVGRKVGNILVVDGEEFREHQDDSAKPTGGEPSDDTH